VCSKVWELNHLFDRQTNNEDGIILFGVQHTCAFRSLILESLAGK